MGNTNQWAPTTPAANNGQPNSPRLSQPVQPVSKQQTNVSISRETGLALAEELEAFCRRSRSTYAAMVSEHGVCIAHAGEGKELYGRSPELPALAVGAFFATRELAIRVGESEFEGLYQQGGDRHFFLAPAGHSHLLVAVFGELTNVGIVRLCAADTAEKVESLLSGQSSAVPSEPQPAAPTGASHPVPTVSEAPLEDVAARSLGRPAPTDWLKREDSPNSDQETKEESSFPSAGSIFAPSLSNFAELEMPNQPFPTG